MSALHTSEYWEELDEIVPGAVFDLISDFYEQLCLRRRVTRTQKELRLLFRLGFLRATVHGPTITPLYQSSRIVKGWRRFWWNNELKILIKGQRIKKVCIRYGHRQYVTTFVGQEICSECFSNFCDFCTEHFGTGWYALDALNEYRAYLNEIF